MLDTYSLDGADLNYEDGVGGSFVECLGQVVTQLKQERDAIITTAPYSNTWDHYRPLNEQYGENIDWINYQMYAEGGDRQAYLNRYAGLAEEVGGYDQLMLGIESSMTGGRGLRPPEIYDVLSQLRADGISGAFVWCMEDSSENNPPFTIEATAEQILVADGAEPDHRST